nr:molecular chaperone [Providencia alcalifaciens]
MKSTLFVLMILLCSYSQAAMMIEGSRVIIKHSQREATLPIKNTSKYPVIIQSWVDDGAPDGTPEKASHSPIISIPTIFRLNENELKYIRLVNKFMPSSTDRESLYWLNLYEITPTPDNEKDNTSIINVAVRLQIKVFYRPDNLNATIGEISDQIQFTLDKGSQRLIIKNPTPFYITFNKLQMGKTGEQLPTMLLNPFSEQQTEIKQNNTNNKILFSLIDDSGEQNHYEKEIIVRW